MTTDSIDLQTTLAPGNIERRVKTCNQLINVFLLMALACGFGLYQTGHLELPSIGQAEPPPQDRGGKIGPLDKEMDAIRKKHWWWLQWLE